MILFLSEISMHSFFWIVFYFGEKLIKLKNDTNYIVDLLKNVGFVINPKLN